MITVVMVNFRTKGFSSACYESFRKFYPDVPMVIVDNGSCDESTEWLRKIAFEDLLVTPLFLLDNIGHGPAMHKGFELCDTPYVFVLDSDTVIKQGGFLEEMLTMFSDECTYAVGDMVITNDSGVNDDSGSLQYIHPSRSMYDLSKYWTMPPATHHGAPLTYNMIYARDNCFQVYPFPIDDYVDHIGFGTRDKVGGWSPGVKLVDTNRPFISFVTRCHKRPVQLLRCLESIQLQNDSDYENVIIVDPIGVGVARANGFYYENRHRVHGKYVLLLDDDDYLCYDDFVSEMKHIAHTKDFPEVIVIKVHHPNNVVLPSKLVWKKSKPVGGHIGGSSVVVRWDIWQKHIVEFGANAVYAGDFDFISELFSHSYRIEWCNRVFVMVPAQNQGAAEDING